VQKPITYILWSFGFLSINAERLTSILSIITRYLTNMEKYKRTTENLLSYKNGMRSAISNYFVFN
jgi:hypothetical protein